MSILDLYNIDDYDYDGCYDGCCVSPSYIPDELDVDNALSDKEILDRMDIKFIEQYLREKKLNKINGK